jgi:p-aminobenzoyl-glutamate transporter AbgT
MVDACMLLAGLEIDLVFLHIQSHVLGTLGYIISLCVNAIVYIQQQGHPAAQQLECSK